jgi:hypothetical protein
MTSIQSVVPSLGHDPPGAVPRRRVIELLEGVSPMRKLVLSLAAVLFVTGLVLADTVTLKSYKPATKEVTVTDKDGKEATYKVTDKTKVMVTDKDGNKKEGTMANLEKMLGNEKLAGKAKFDITTSGDTITEITTKGGKKN